MKPISERDLGLGSVAPAAPGDTTLGASAQSAAVMQQKLAATAALPRQIFGTAEAHPPRDEIQETRPLGGWPKRTLDVTLASVLLLIAAPMMLLIAGTIALSSRGSPIFAHKRVGFQGQIFHCYKFRTMVRDADAALARYIDGNPEAAAEWAARRKLRHDPRVTMIGRVLRKCSADELPQFINVLLGDMSCVGPRPVTMEELPRYGAQLGAYLCSRPGITGLWQVQGRSSTDFTTRVEIDERYVRGWSFLGDVGILARTPLAVLRLSQAH